MRKCKSTRNYGPKAIEAIRRILLDKAVRRSREATLREREMGINKDPIEVALAQSPQQEFGVWDVATADLEQELRLACKGGSSSGR